MTMTTRRLIAILVVPFAVMLAAVVVATYAIPHVTLKVERDAYPVGGTVRFSLHNGLSEPVFLACPSPWQISREVEGGWQPVEAHFCPAVIVTVEPGEKVNWTWLSRTMTDRPDLAPVGPGQYRIDVSVMTECTTPGSACRILHLTAYFRLA